MISRSTEREARRRAQRHDPRRLAVEVRGHAVGGLHQVEGEQDDGDRVDRREDDVGRRLGDPDGDEAVAERAVD